MIPPLSAWCATGNVISARKKVPVNIRTKKMSFRSEIRCMKYEATSVPLMLAINIATIIAGTTDKWKYDTVTVMIVRVSKATNTVIYRRT